MTATYDPIATTTLTSSTNTITFSSIPNTFTDLRLILVLRATMNQFGQFRINGDTGSNYSYTWLDGSGAAAATGRGTNDSFIYLSQRTIVSAQPSFYTLDFFSYAGSTNKTILTTNNQDANGSGFVGNQVALWRNTAAINQISLISGVTLYDVGTTATLYGIKSE